MKKLILIGLIMVTSMILVGCGNQKAFAGQASGFGLAAESCDGDQTCEMLNARIGGKLITDSITASRGKIEAFSAGSSVVDTVSSADMFTARRVAVSERVEADTVIAREVRASDVATLSAQVSGTLTADSITAGRGRIETFMAGSSVVDTVSSADMVTGRRAVLSERVETNEIYGTSLIDPSGLASNAFVCVNGVGKLFRSDVPCR